MASEIAMPRLSDSMEEGTVLAWLKAVGDDVARGDELVEIETDKANMVYEADVAGTLLEIVVAVGETAAVGAPIAHVGAPGETVGGGGDAPAPATTSAPEPVAAAAIAEAPAASGRNGGVKASPVAKRLARDRGIDLATVTGSGPGGRIVKADVESAAAGGAPAAAASPAPAAPAAPAAAPAASGAATGTTTTVAPTKLQQTVARRMQESKTTAPHFHLRAEVDMSAAVAARAGLKRSAREGDVVPSFNDMVVKACAIALTEHPRANGSYRDGRFEEYSRVNVGIAVAGQDALVVPTILDADRKGLREIAVEARSLAGRVRDGSIAPAELGGGTFTVSNLGMYGIRSFEAVINPPQAGIVAVGEIRDAPVVRDGVLAVGQLMDLTLACDHRILYGADAAQLLGRIRALLEEPVGLAL